MRRLRSMLLMLLTVGVLAGALTLLNVLPVAVSDAPVRAYPDLDAARHALGWRRVLLPAYLPASIAWPPSEVLAGTEPVPMLVVLFRRQGSDQVVLSFAQVQATREVVAPRVVPSDDVVETRRDVGGREATLWEGRCPEGGSCSKISWQDGEFHLSIGLRDDANELVRMAHSVFVHVPQ